TRACLYKSSIVSASAFTSLSADPTRPRAVLGSEDGSLRFYDLLPRLTRNTTLTIEPRLMKTVNIREVRQSLKQQYVGARASPPPARGGIEIISSRPSWRSRGKARSGTGGGAYSGMAAASESDKKGDSEDPGDVEIDRAIIALHHARFDPVKTAGGFKARLDPTSMSEQDWALCGARVRLIVGSADALVVLDADTFAELFCLDFRSKAAIADVDSLGIAQAEGVAVDADEHDPCCTINVAGAFGFCSSSAEPNSTTIMIANTFSGLVVLVNLREQMDKDSLRVITREDAPQPCDEKEPSLQDIIQSAMNGQARGGWSNNVKTDCLMELAAAGIRSVEDLRRPNALVSIVGMPKYIKAALERSIRKDGGADICEVCTFAAPASFTVEKNSPLRCQVQPGVRAAKKPTAVKPSASTPRVGVKQIMNHPVTFKSKVRSSGYTEAPKVTKMFTGPSARSSTTRPLASKSPETRKYPADCEPITNISERCPPIRHTAPIIKVKYHGSGRLLATVSADRTARFYNMASRERSGFKDLIGHDGTLTGVSWSQGVTHNPSGSPTMITSSTDGTVRMWSTDRSDPLLIIRQVRGSPKPSAEAGSPRTASLSASPRVSSTKKDDLLGELRATAFFESDRLVLVPDATRLHIYTYSIQRTERGSVRPGLNYNTYKHVAAFTHPSTSITALAAANAFASHLVLTATTDRSIRVWDAAGARVVSTLADAGVRAVHCLAIADYADVPSAFANVFASAAVTDAVKLWDVRVGKAVMHLLGHADRAAGMGCALSPCGRFLATGSEDNHAYLYDVRKGLVIGKLKGGTDVVSAVDFNPICPELVTGSHDGLGRLFQSA
ncbi:WD40-repeat-containing domain protein, partial [Blyttiomyces helicus]